MHFRVIFVMDLLDGAVVHAKRGERERYKPIHTFSSVSTSSDPIQIMDQFKPEEVYVADLNRLMNNGDNRALLRKLRKRYGAIKIMLDYGIKSFEDLRAAFEAELADCFVLGTETISLEMIEAATKSDIPVSVSIDLLHKAVLTRDTRLKLDPLELLKTLNDYPVQDIIMLELDRVGTKSGIDYGFFEHAVAISEHSILCGGGVKNHEDLAILENKGVKGALVATALHDGSIPVSALRKSET